MIACVRWPLPLHLYKLIPLCCVQFSRKDNLRRHTGVHSVAHTQTHMAVLHSARPNHPRQAAVKLRTRCVSPQALGPRRRRTRGYFHVGVAETQALQDGLQTKVSADEDTEQDAGHTSHSDAVVLQDRCCCCCYDCTNMPPLLSNQSKSRKMTFFLILWCKVKATPGRLTGFAVYKIKQY